MASLVFAADRAGRLTPSQKNYLWQQFSIAGIRTSEPPELDFPHEKPAVVDDLINAHINVLGYSLGEMKQMLVASDRDLEELYSIRSNNEGNPRPWGGLRLVK